MIRRGTPKNIDDFIKINDENLIKFLNQGNFFADYMDATFLYFRRSEDFLEYIKNYTS